MSKTQKSPPIPPPLLVGSVEWGVGSVEWGVGSVEWGVGSGDKMKVPAGRSVRLLKKHKSTTLSKKSKLIETHERFKER